MAMVNFANSKKKEKEEQEEEKGSMITIIEKCKGAFPRRPELVE